MSKKEFTPGEMVRAMKQINRPQTHAGSEDRLNTEMDEASANFDGSADPDATPVIPQPDDAMPLGSRDIAPLQEI